MALLQLGRTDVLRIHKLQVPWFIDGGVLRASWIRVPFPGTEDLYDPLPRDWLRKVADDPTITRVQINASHDALTADFLRSPT